jgi:hypothetical protein
VATVWYTKRETYSSNAPFKTDMKQLNIKIDEFSREVIGGFHQVQADLADNSMDNLMGYLTYIANAYQHIDRLNAVSAV